MFGALLPVLCLVVCVNSATVPDTVMLPPPLPQGRKLNFGDLEITQTENDVGENNFPTTGELNVCSSEICASESQLMLSKLDQSIDPCENFYDFACGQYIQKTTLPEDKAVQMSFFELQDKVNEQIRSVLIEEPESFESHPFRLAKELTKICMDESTLNEKGITPMIEILESYGGWPVVHDEQWKSDEWNWLETIKKISSDGLVDDLILEFSIRPDLRNSTKRIIYIDRPDFGLSEKFLLQGIENPEVKAYYNFMVDAAVLFGANRTNAELELLDALNFETELAKISLSVEERRNITVLLNEYTIKKLQTTFAYVNWLDFISWNLNYSVSVDENELVLVPDQNYLFQLDAVLRTTPKRTIANYFSWRLVLYASDLLNDVLHQRYQQYVAATTGMQESEPRLTECVERTISLLPISVGATYIWKYFNEESKKSAHTLAKAIHNEFIKTLQTVQWMDEATRQAAIEKANAMHFRIAYPHELVDPNETEKYYEGLELQADSLLHSYLRINRFKKSHDVQKLHQPIDKMDWKDWATRITSVDAFYAPTENSIQLPAAILQDRFFAAERPSYMNFGAIGWFVGHEVTHGFDDTGRQFDMNGNLADWWDKDTAAKFASQAQCFIDKYSKYTHPTQNLTVNGVNTQGENIADIGGVKTAYSAYQQFVQQNGIDQILPGMNFTPNQLFWISAAQVWCAVTRPEFDTLQYTTNVHSPFNYRVIGAFSSSYNFSSDFNCPLGTQMNPVEKCEIW